jgi:hypothetical protein
MRLLLTTLLCLGLSFSAAAQTTWQEYLHAYHDLMSSTFHPAEEGDMGPIKAKAPEMAALAKAWSKADLPEKEGDLKKALKTLAQGSRTVARLVRKNYSDDVIGEALTDLHDQFHAVAGLCSDLE